MTRTGFKAFPGRWLTCTAALASAFALSLSATLVIAQDSAPKKSAESTKPKKTAKRAPDNDPPELWDTGQCLKFSEIEDRDGDFERNEKMLKSKDLCLKQHVFHEGGLRWVLQIIQNKADPKKVFWFVPHDNEQAAFDTAVQAVLQHQGTVVALETGGQRRNGEQDPNRNFDAGTNIKCKDQVAFSPSYTENVMRWHPAGAPIIALHTNSGKGGISISKPIKGPIAFAAANPIKSKSPDHTLIFVASNQSPTEDSHMKRFVQALNENGIHVLYETVSAKRNDCSLSNYAALRELNKNYINIEVVEGDGKAQVEILSKALPLLKESATARPRQAAIPRPQPALRPR